MSHSLDTLAAIRLALSIAASIYDRHDCRVRDDVSRQLVADRAWMEGADVTLPTIACLILNEGDVSVPVTKSLPSNVRSSRPTVPTAPP